MKNIDIEDVTRGALVACAAHNQDDTRKDKKGQPMKTTWPINAENLFGFSQGADLIPVTVRAETDVAPRQAFEAAAPVDLTRIFVGFGPLPAVVEVRDQTDPWGRVGASRRPVLSDDAAAFERITRYEPHTRFAYEVSGFTNALGRLVTGALGEWIFEPADGGGPRPRGPTPSVPVACGARWRGWRSRRFGACTCAARSTPPCGRFGASAAASPQSTRGDRDGR